MTLTDGHAAVHQAILGDRLRLYLDAELCQRVCPGPGQLAHPGLVWDVAIGQSTVLTQRVIGNLFYRGLSLRRAPRLGDTLQTATEVVALRQNSPRPGRAATGVAALRIRTVDQEDRPVLDFWRGAMLPLRDPDGETEQADDLAAVGAEVGADDFAAPFATWDLAAYRELVPGPHFGELTAPCGWEVPGGDVVSSAPELARLSLNIAATHHDLRLGRRGRRLVYGGHTIGIAAAQLSRAVPSLASIVAWHSCEHLAPVHEGDTLWSAVELERADQPRPGGGGFAHLRCRVWAEREEGQSQVLDWRLVGLLG
ncbi:MAG TPA: acyl dehydratase [Solirubrobacterales bacterium]|jgi:acyl dehydratase